MCLLDFDVYNERQVLEKKESMKKELINKLFIHGVSEKIMGDFLGLLLLGQREMTIEAENILKHFGISDLELSSYFDDDVFLDNFIEHNELEQMNYFEDYYEG